MSPYEQLIVTYRAEKRALPLATVAKLPSIRSEAPLPAMSYGRYRKGRYTWAGFRLGAGADDDDTQRAFKELFTSTVAWLGGLPSVTTERWPKEARRGIALVVEPSAERQLNSLETITALNVPFTFATPASLLNNLKQQQVSLPSRADAAIILDEAFLAERRSDIRNWLPALRKRASNVLGVPVNGILLPGSVGKQGAEICREAGFTYVLVEQETGAPRHVKKISEVRRLGPLEKPHEIASIPMRRGLADAERAESEHCVYINDDDIPQISTWLDENRNDTWLTTAHDLARWDMKRCRLRMTREFLPGSRVRVRVSNASYETMKPMPFKVDFYESTEAVGIWPKAVGLEAPEATAMNEHSWEFTIDQLAPGKTAEYVMTPTFVSNQVSSLEMITPQPSTYGPNGVRRNM